MASAVSLSGSMVMRTGVMFGIDFILSVGNTRNNMLKKKHLLYHEKSVLFTYFVDHFDHLLYLVGADVGTVSEPEVDEDPLAEEVLALGGLVVVIDERERTAQRRPTNRFGSFLFDHCNS